MSSILQRTRRFFMLSCRDINAFLASYLEGTLDARTHARFERHIARCAQCGSYLDQYRKTIELAKTNGTAKLEAPPEELAEWTLVFLRKHYQREVGRGNGEEGTGERENGRKRE